MFELKTIQNNRQEIPEEKTNYKSNFPPFFSANAAERHQKRALNAKLNKFLAFFDIRPAEIENLAQN